MRRRIAVFSLEGDLHALAIQNALRTATGVECHVVEVPALVRDGGLNWELDDRGHVSRAALRSRDGDWFDARELDVIWWRRVERGQRDHPALVTEVERDLVSSEWKSALFGVIASGFSGCWINHPRAEVWAGNKLVQLACARQAGFVVPRTLVSQDPARIAEFARKLEGSFILKALRGTPKRPLAAVAVHADHLPDEDSIRLCPAIYQEQIDGRRHVRANCFGSDIAAVEIETDDVDWRQNLNVPFRIFQVNETLRGRLARLLQILGLSMGIVDLKLNPDGEVVFLEINPQGQFLFAQPLSGLDLTTRFANFLLGHRGPALCRHCAVSPTSASRAGRPSDARTFRRTVSRRRRRC